MLDIAIPDSTVPGERVRILPPSEWYRIEPVFQAQGVPLPHPDFAGIVVIESAEASDEGVYRLAGFMVIQLVPHLEPIWINPAKRGTDLWKRLVAAAKAQFAPGVPFYVFTPNPALERMAEESGLAKLPWSVHRGQN
jgi:hypothetical protein